MNIPKASTSSSTAPDIEDGLFVARFNDIYLKQHEDWAQAKDKFGHPDDGSRFHFSFTILDEDREPVLREDAEDPDETLDLEAMARPSQDGAMSASEKSTSYKLMKGILTPQEMALWVAGALDDGSAIANREVNVQVGHNTKGWPQIEATLGPAKPKKAAK